MIHILLNYVLPILSVIITYLATYHLVMVVDYYVWKIGITRLEGHMRSFYTILIAISVSCGVVFSEYEPACLIIFGIGGAILCLALIFNIDKQHKSHPSRYHYFMLIVGTSLFQSIPIMHLATNALLLAGWIR
jgi:hypothetical protein